VGKKSFVEDAAVRNGWTREDSLRMAYLVATGQLICEVYKGRDTEDIPDRLKSLLAQLGAYDKEQARSDDPLANSERASPSSTAAACSAPG
jgi:hypothetical protein